MKLFTVGPVEKFKTTLKISSQNEPYFRNDQFSNLMLDNEKHIKRLLNANESAKVVFLCCSGTGAMEASVINAFDKTYRLLIINGGSFGQRFCEICDVNEIHYYSIKIDELENFDASNFSALLVNMHETSTGELYPMDKISDFCKKYNLKLVVDAISSFLADEIDFKKLGIDIILLSSQKALALRCGMACVVLSERMVNALKPCRSYYFNFKDYLINQTRGQTPFTPAVGILFELNNRIKNLDLHDELKRVKNLATLFRKNIRCEIPKYPLSNALTPIYVSDAKKMYERLKDQYGFEVTPSGGKMADKLLRIGHLGDLCENDILDLARYINEIL